MLDEYFKLDEKLAREQRNRSGETFLYCKNLYAALAEQTMERLQLCKLEPKRILNIGTGSAGFTAMLAQQYRDSNVYEFDRAFKRLTAMKSQRRFWFSKTNSQINAELHQLPIDSKSIDLAVCNLEFSWCNNIDAALNNIYESLRPGGLLMFSALGPDTLQELRASWTAVDDTVHVHGHLDMHDLGDALIRAGFHGPVLDVDRYVLTYASAASLSKELKNIGATNVASGRRKTLTGKVRYARMLQHYEQWRRDDLIPATIELVFAHAWVPLAHERPQDGSTVAVFPFESLRKSLHHK